MRAVLGLSVVVLSACQCGALDPSARFACSTDAQCGPGSSCVAIGGVLECVAGATGGGATGGGATGGGATGGGATGGGATGGGATGGGATGGGVTGGGSATGGGGTNVVHQLALTTMAVGLRAGDCFAANVKAVDSSQAPVILTANETIALFVTPTDGLRFFADAQCATPITATTIIAGQSSQAIYVKAISGGSNTMSATNSITSTMLTLSVIGAVHRGSCVLAPLSTSVSCPITTPLRDTSRTLLVYQAISGAQLRHASVMCALQSDNSILCSRVGTANNVTIQWQTLELPSQLTVQRGSASPCSTTVGLINAPSPAATFTLGSTTGSDDTFNGDDLVSVRLAPSSLSFDFATACTSVEFQVATWSGITVTRGSTNGMDAGVAVTSVTNLSPASPNSVVLTQGSMVGAPAPPASTSLCSFFARGVIDTPTSVRLTRDAAATCVTAALGNSHWQRVDFGAQAQVQSFTTVMALTLATDTLTLNSAVDLTRTLVFASGNLKSGLGNGEVSDTNDKDKINDGTATFELLSSTQVRLTRENPRNTGTFTWYAVQVEP